MIWDWSFLSAELSAWRRAGRRPQLWWRDDDAVAASQSLERLLSIASYAGVPLSLAVIPERVEKSLAALVNFRRSVTVMQHGTDHWPASGRGAPTQFPPAVPADVIAAWLSSARAPMRQFHHRLPVYAPPWNDLQDNVVAALPMAGFRGVSGFDGAGPATSLRRVDTHLDLMRWSPAPRFRGEGRFLRRMTRLLRTRRRQGAWDEPIGLLTHHLDHDEAAWAFLQKLLRRRDLKAQADWRSAADLFGAGAAEPTRPVHGYETALVS